MTEQPAPEPVDLDAFAERMSGLIEAERERFADLPHPVDALAEPGSPLVAYLDFAGQTPPSARAEHREWVTARNALEQAAQGAVRDALDMHDALHRTVAARAAEAALGRLQRDLAERKEKAEADSSVVFKGEPLTIKKIGRW